MNYFFLVSPCLPLFPCCAVLNIEDRRKGCELEQSSIIERRFFWNLGQETSSALSNPAERFSLAVVFFLVFSSLPLAPHWASFSPRASDFNSDSPINMQTRFRSKQQKRSECLRRASRQARALLIVSAGVRRVWRHGLGGHRGPNHYNMQDRIIQ